MTAEGLILAAESGRQVEIWAGSFRSSRRFVGSFFAGCGSGVGKFSGADGHLARGFLIRLPQDSVPDGGQVL